MAKKRRRRDGISFRNWDGCWYSSVTGKKKPLLDENGKKIRGADNEAEARKAFYRLSLSVTSSAAGAKTISDVAAGFVAYSKNNSSPTRYNTVRIFLEKFLSFLGPQKLVTELTL
jgi:hypothetical protein